MNETPTQKIEPPRASAPAGPIIATFNRVVQLIPPKARLADLRSWRIITCLEPVWLGWLGERMRETGMSRGGEP